MLLLLLPKGVTITCPDHLSSSFFFVFAKMHLKGNRKRLSRLSLKGEKELRVPVKQLGFYHAWIVIVVFRILQIVNNTKCDVSFNVHSTEIHFLSCVRM